MPQDSDKRIEFYKDRKATLESILKKNNVLRRQDWWSLAYFKNPYLVETSVENLHKRYQDIIGNLTTLTEAGQIALSKGTIRDGWLSLAMHVQEELFARGAIPTKADNDFHLPIPSYPEEPRGLKILTGYNLPKTSYLVKCGKPEHLRSMIEMGEIKISPASSYNDENLTAAIRDNELELFAYYSSLNLEATSLGRAAKKMSNLTNKRGETSVKRTLSNFYLHCTTYKYDHRLLDDFKADAIVIIREPATFIKKLQTQVHMRNSSLVLRAGPVQYYDPYFVEDWNRESDGFVKHFRYAYQNEFRICWTDRTSSFQAYDPFFVSIGDMRTYSDILFST